MKVLKFALSGLGADVLVGCNVVPEGHSYNCQFTNKVNTVTYEGTNQADKLVVAAAILDCQKKTKGNDAAYAGCAVKMSDATCTPVKI